jgi:hypothetical protein
VNQSSNTKSWDVNQLRSMAVGSASNGQVHCPSSGHAISPTKVEPEDMFSVAGVLPIELSSSDKKPGRGTSLPVKIKELADDTCQDLTYRARSLTGDGKSLSDELAELLQHLNASLGMREILRVETKELDGLIPGLLASPFV